MSFLSKLFGLFKKPEVQQETKSYDSDYQNNFNFDDEYFARIINVVNFPECTFERDVHPSVYDFNAHPSCLPVTIMIKKGGTPVLAVMIMKENQRNAMIARGTYSILEDNGIKYIRFYREMPNEKYYVINRVRENLI